jgi:hypothetical protein
VTATTDWKTGTPKQLLADLRPGGWVLGQSGRWPQYLRLHKTDLSSDIRKLPADHACIWKIIGNPEETGTYAKNRRTVLVWLGK